MIAHSGPERATEVFDSTVFTRADLRSAGLRGRELTALVRSGRLLRLRRDRYARPDVDPVVAEAVRIGGRVTCVSLLQLLGVFVLAAHGVHVQVDPHSSRLGRRDADAHRVHWAEDGAASALHVTSLDTAVRHAVRCQSPRALVATLDSLLHQRLITMDELRAIFARLPQRFGAVLALADASSESGPETFVRLLLRSLGASFETQVHIPGVGRVDFVVDGWLIVECDSRAFHEGWAKQQRDRARDMAAARLGYVTIRPLAADILSDPAGTREALREVLDALGPRLVGARRSQLRRKGSRSLPQPPNRPNAPRSPEL